MLSSRFQGAERMAIRSASTMPLAGTDQRRMKSGVYSTQQAALDWPAVLPVDDDEPVTNVRHDKPEPTAPVSTGSALPEQRAARPIWHVGMVLDADELSRLWARNAEALRDRVFVWSDLANSWMSLHGATQSAVTVGLRPMNQAGASPVRQAQHAEDGAMRGEFADGRCQIDGATPVDLTEVAQLVPNPTPFRRAPIIAVIGIGLAALACAGLYRATTVRSARASSSVQSVAASRSDFGATESNGVRATPMGRCNIAETSRGSAIGATLEDAVPVENLPILVVSRRLATF